MKDESGCLFEDELCTTYEFCVDDGVFGRCQQLAHADLNTYDISPSALQRLRILLQKLAHRGLTWQDDLTQQVISRELSKLRSVPRHQATLSSPLAALSRSRERKLRPAQAQLNGHLQQYLTGLGFLPHPEDYGRPGIHGEEDNVQNEDVKSSSNLEPSRSKPQQGWKETTLYSLHKGDGKPPVTKVFTKSGEGRHPGFSTTVSKQDPERSKLLSSQLGRLLSETPSAQQASRGGAAEWPEGKVHYLSYVRPAPGENAQPQSKVAFTSKSERPNLDRLLLKAGSNRPNAKEPLGVMDDRFIQNMVNQLGRHSVHMEALMGDDLDQLAQVLTGRLHEERPVVVVRPGPGAAELKGGKDGNGEPAAAMNQDQDLKADKGLELKQKDAAIMKQPGQQEEAADEGPVDKHEAFFSKLLDYLNLDHFSDAPEVNMRPAGLQKMVGLENVQSRTTQGKVPVPLHWEEKTIKTPAREGSTLRLTGGAKGPDAQVDSEIQSWMRGQPGPAGIKQPEELRNKDMKVKTQLVHIGVKEFASRGKDRHFGYIITGSDSLTNEQASALMEHLAQRLNLHAADLTQLSVLGPALTFRIGHNPKNISTADLVQVAGKTFLFFLFVMEAIAQ
ncbi:receptor-type tyrosine-protein phosphatase N2-like [Labrus mixtus]|uniref:receptor-type tyrosine-protein phosphatase N2-like n=1 Tax=Labrus mixtus TaxID=508554 RepID=UPI0029C08E72|nr:receptor-type tyrosine-protein phosphatase N2-like [Labrus mixtus]